MKELEVKVNRTNSGANVWDNEVDVIIAGAGGTGIAAAIELASAKASIIVFEKQPTIEDSSSSLCGGVYTFAGTDYQKKQGIKDSNDLLYKDLMTVGQWKNDEKLVQAYVKNQLDTYQWMTGFGVKWIALEALAGMSVPRGHVTDPTAALRILKGVAEKKGAKFTFNTAVTGLVTDANNSVIGAIAKRKYRSLRIRARKGVLLATGGFGRDLKRLATVDPRLQQVVPVMGPGHTGEGHKMAEGLGAFFKDMEYIKPTFGIHTTGTSNAQLSQMYFNGAIIVNKEGKRYVNESISYKDIGKATLAQTGAIGYQIFDQNIFQIGVDRVKGLPSDKALWGLEENRIKLLVKADSIDELAIKLGIPPKALSETVDKYNQGVTVGKDSEFGRTALAGGVGNIISIATPPLYCYASKGLLPGTYGGIVVDENMQVLTSEGKVQGLYAAGEIVGGFHGASYMSGTAVGKAVIFGRIAAKTLGAQG